MNNNLEYKRHLVSYKAILETQVSESRALTKKLNKLLQEVSALISPDDEKEVADFDKVQQIYSEASTMPTNLRDALREVRENVK